MAEQSWKEERKRNFERLLQRGREETEQHRGAACFPDLVAALKYVEWRGPDGLCPCCPVYSDPATKTHSPYCQLAAALAKAKESRLQQQDLDEETL